MGHPGLSRQEAERRLAEIGPNEVQQRGRISVWSSVGAQLRDPLILVLLGALLLTLATGDLTEALVIAFVVVANTTVGVVQEVRADHAITALAQLSAPTVRVRRDGTEAEVATTLIVPGDVVLLGEGDIVPGDCELLEASSLLIDESALTGESVPVGKAVTDAGGDVVSAGTVVMKGRAEAVVRATGADSALGQIAALLDGRVRLTPLQRRLAGLGRVLALVALASCLLVLVIGVTRGQPLEQMVVTAISLAVAAVPESLPAVVTLALALGARRMAARHAVVRKLPAVETLGSVTVLATDKTGTLTAGSMVVEALWTPDRLVRLDAGELGDERGPVDVDDAVDVRQLLTAGVLCNDARLLAEPQPGRQSAGPGVGDPTEVALLAAAVTAGLHREALERRYPRVDEQPFDSQLKYMTTVHRSPGHDELLVVTKGSVEALHVRLGSPSSPEWLAALQAAADLADQGLRVIAVSAGHTAAGRTDDHDWRDAPERLLGLVAMADPAKPSAASTIDQCRRAGITPVLITGDHPATARAIAARVGVLDPDQATDADLVATGARIASDPALDLTLPRVFARTSPEQKLDIVDAWQERGEVVAMTGDGVNDGPALRHAHIGVAMGRRGTEVARQAADLVLADDELETVVAAVEEGRRVYDNIRMFLLFGIAGGAAEVLLMLLGPFVGFVTPLLATQILWINLITHGLTGVAMGAEPVSPDAMRRAPRPPSQSVLADGLWQRIVALAALMTTVTLAVGLWARAGDRPWQTLVFLTLASLQLGTALGLRPRQLTVQNPALPVAVTVSLLLALAAVHVPVLQELLHTTTLSGAETLFAVALGAVGWGAARMTRMHQQRRRAVLTQ